MLLIIAKIFSRLKANFKYNSQLAVTISPDVVGPISRLISFNNRRSRRSSDGDHEYK